FAGDTIADFSRTCPPYAFARIACCCRHHLLASSHWKSHTWAAALASVAGLAVFGLVTATSLVGELQTSLVRNFCTPTLLRNVRRIRPWTHLEKASLS